MIQQILIVLIFVAAVAYLGRLIFKSFQANECATGCGKCGVDFSQVEKKMKEKGV